MSWNGQGGGESGRRRMRPLSKDAWTPGDADTWCREGTGSHRQGGRWGHWRPGSGGTESGRMGNFLDPEGKRNDLVQVWYQGASVAVSQRSVAPKGSVQLVGSPEVDCWTCGCFVRSVVLGGHICGTKASAGGNLFQLPESHMSPEVRLAAV